MIPHRMLSNESSGSELKERVTACRKRLRMSRGTHRANPLNDAQELFPETAPSVSEVHSYSREYLELPTSTICRPSLVDGRDELKDSETLLSIAEHEVGIT
jgi:hypothetical protein